MYKIFYCGMTLPLLFNCSVCIADSLENTGLKNSSWADGNEMYFFDAVNSNDKEFVFIGGTPHEGGAIFKLTNLIKDNHRVIGAKFSIPYFIEDYNAKLEFLKNANGDKSTVLVVKSKNGNIAYTYVPLAESNSFDLSSNDLGNEYYSRLKMFNEASVFETLIGTYGDESGYQITFTHEELSKNDPNYNSTCTFYYGCGTRYIIKIKQGDKEFVEPAKFNYSYDFATTVFKLPNDDKNTFVFATAKGIDLYNSNEDFYRVEPKLRSLEYIDHKTPRFGYLSERILTLSYINRFDHDVQELMRNEIFARHGYTFKREDLKNYFEKQNWYHPKDKVDDLSEIEMFNVSIIKMAEAMK